MATWPDPNATRSAIDAFVADHLARPPSSGEPPHEAPPVENGPSLVCNACSKVRVPLHKPFCDGCMAQMGG